MYKPHPQKPEPKTLKEAFARLLRNKNNEAGYFRARTRLVWEEFFGQHTAQHTRKLMVRNRKLYVYVDNAPLRNQLMMIREGIRKRLNEEFGEEYLEEVIVR